MNRYSYYADRYSQPDFWTQDASHLTTGDWLFFLAIAAVIVLIRVAIVAKHNARVDKLDRDHQAMLRSIRDGSWRNER